MHTIVDKNTRRYWVSNAQKQLLLPSHKFIQ